MQKYSQTHGRLLQLPYSQSKVEYRYWVQNRNEKVSLLLSCCLRALHINPDSPLWYPIEQSLSLVVRDCTYMANEKFG